MGSDAGGPKEEEEEKKESISLGYQPKDLTDVQVIAWLQEESRCPGPGVPHHSTAICQLKLP